MFIEYLVNSSSSLILIQYQCYNIVYLRFLFLALSLLDQDGNIIIAILLDFQHEHSMPLSKFKPSKSSPLASLPCQPHRR